MSFKADYTVDELDFLSFARINRYVRGRVSRKLLRVLTAAAALIFAGLCVTLTMRGAWTAKNAIIIGIGVLLIIWELRRDRFSANESRRNIRRYVDRMSLSADENGMDIVSGENVEHLDYKRIAELYHCRESLFIYLADERAYIIPDKSFRQGTAKEFAEFVAKKCGKSLSYINL